MRPPLTLDIGWSDLLAAAWLCVVATDSERATTRVESLWSTSGDAVAGLTVRTLFDAWLRARAFDEGDEILMTAFTLPDMARVVRENGLVPVALDVDPATLAPTERDLDARWSARTRAIIVAHLFGSRCDLAPTLAWARRRGVDVVEDAAQAYAADGWTGTDGAAASLFSFGTIKTATALGGGVARVGDARVRGAMQNLLSVARPQPRREFLVRVLHAAMLRILGARPIYGAFVRACELFGQRHDDVARRGTRSIRGSDFLAAIRRRPSAPLLALIARRLDDPPSEQIALRAARGEALLRRIADRVSVPGARAAVRSHWLLPICVVDRARALSRLRRAGIDAAPSGSVAVIGAAPRLLAMESGLLYLPVPVDLEAAEIERIADAIV